MILGIDLGGTKVLLGLFSDRGELLKSHKFPTPQDYPEFLKLLKLESARFELKDVEKIVVAVPGRIDRNKNRVVSFGNLDWHNVSIADDIEESLGRTTLMENDAKVGALGAVYEAKLTDQKVLYVTIGTGIGTGIVSSGQLDHSLIDSEGGQILLPFESKLVPWETFASGKAIVRRFGKKAAEITDKNDWQTISEGLGLGIIDLCAVIQPDVVVLGGGVSTHFDRFGKYLEEFVAKNKNDLIKMPRIIAAKNPEQAALKGCYVYANQNS